MFDTCSANNINLDIFLTPRDSNKEADKLRKEIDYDHWSVLGFSHFLAYAFTKPNIFSFIR